MARDLIQLVREYEGFLDREGIEADLQWRHQMRVAVGLGGCLAVVAYNLMGTAGNEPAVEVTRALVYGLTLVVVLFGTLVILWRQEAELARLKAPTSGVVARAAQVSGYILRRDWMLLGIALLGQGLVALATTRGLRFTSVDGPLLGLNLVATVQLVICGWREIPTRKRLLYLYKLVTLHQLRAQRQAEKDDRLSAQQGG